MGTVERARDLGEGSAVALKLLGGGAAIDVARFEREARLLARMRQPAVVPLSITDQARARADL